MDPTELTPESLAAIRNSVQPQVTLQPVDHNPFEESATFDQRFNALPVDGGTPLMPGQKIWSPTLGPNGGTLVEGTVPKTGHNVQPVDVAGDINRTRQSAVNAAGEFTGVNDAARVASGEMPWTEAAAAAIPMVLGGPEARAAEEAVGIGSRARDPRLWHGISQVKLPKPIEEMTPRITPVGDVSEKIIKPADIQGGLLLPAIGDRSAAGGELTGFNGYNFNQPVELQGGHGYMAENSPRGAVWASNKGVITQLDNKAKALAESGSPVYFPYTAMGERSVDFSHHVSDALSAAIPQAKITPANMKLFDQSMMTDVKDFPADKNWPGVDSPNLREYLQNASGNVRNKFAKTMDTATFQKAGFPSVAEARHAVTDPRLLNEPTGASGLSISRLNPGGTRPDPMHNTYQVALPGQYEGGFGASVPKEIMYPDLIEHYNKVGYEPVRHDYLMQRGLRGAPIAQKANQQWVDTVSNFLRSKGVLPSGAAIASPFALQPVDHQPDFVEQ